MGEIESSTLLLANGEGGDSKKHILEKDKDIYNEINLGWLKTCRSLGVFSISTGGRDDPKFIYGL